MVPGSVAYFLGAQVWRRLGLRTDTLPKNQARQTIVEFIAPIVGSKPAPKHFQRTRIVGSNLKTHELFGRKIAFPHIITEQFSDFCADQSNFQRQLSKLTSDNIFQVVELRCRSPMSDHRWWGSFGRLAARGRNIDRADLRAACKTVDRRRTECGRPQGGANSGPVCPQRVDSWQARSKFPNTSKMAIRQE